MTLAFSDITPVNGTVVALDTTTSLTAKALRVSGGAINLLTLKVACVIFKTDGSGNKYYEYIIYNGVIQPGWTGTITSISPGIPATIVQGFELNFTRDNDWRTPNPTEGGLPTPIVGGLTQNSLTTLADPGNVIRFQISLLDTVGFTQSYGDLSPPPEVWAAYVEDVKLENLTPVSNLTASHNIISGLTFACDLTTNSPIGRDFIDLTTLNVYVRIRHTQTSSLFAEPVILGGAFTPYWSGSITDIVNGHHIIFTRSQIWSQGFSLLGEPVRLHTSGSSEPSNDIGFSFDVSDLSFYPHPYRFGSSTPAYATAFSSYRYSAYQASTPWTRRLAPFTFFVTPSTRDPTQHATKEPTDTGISFDIRASSFYAFTVLDLEIFILPDGASSSTSEICYTSGGGFVAPYTGSIAPFGTNRYQFTLNRNQDWTVGPSPNFPSTVPITIDGTIGIKIRATIDGDFSDTLYFGSVVPPTLLNPEDQWSWYIESGELVVNPSGLTAPSNPVGLLQLLFSQLVQLPSVGAAEDEGSNLGVVSVFPTNVDLFPKQDTFHGGTELYVHGQIKLVNTELDHDFRRQGLPPAWIPSTSLNGRVRSSFQGVTLTTGVQAGSYARLDTAPLHEACSATLRVRVLTPDHALASPVTCLAFSYRVDNTNYATIRIRRNALVSTKQVTIDTVVGLADELMIGGAVTLSPLQDIELQVVRVQKYAFLLVNGQQLVRTSRFSATGVGSFQISVSNDGQVAKVATLVQSLQVRSHALIAGRLLQNKNDIADRRIVGTVPSASLSEVGFHDIILFGPWGVAIQAGTFKYVLPNGRQIGGATGVPLTSYVDSSVKT